MLSHDETGGKEVVMSHRAATLPRKHERAYLIVYRRIEK
jgi:hypothetical protein